MVEETQIIELKNVINAVYFKIKNREEFIDIAKNNKVENRYKHGKLHFMLLTDGIYQIKTKK